MIDSAPYRAGSQQPSGDAWYLGMAFVPLLMGLLLVAVIMVSWWTQSDQLQETRAELLQDRPGSSDEVTIQWMDERSSAENTARWKRVLDASEAILATQAGVILEKTLDDVALPQPGGDWLFAGGSERFAQDAALVLAELDLIRQESTVPIWLPIQFDGVGALLPEIQQLHGLARVLRFDFTDAVHRRDTQRAIKTLERFDVFDQGTGVELAMNEVVSIACSELRLLLIEKSLRYDFWSEDELTQLAEMLRRPVAWDQRWQIMLENEALFEMSVAEDPRRMSAIDSLPEALVTVVPSAVHSHLQMLRSISKLSGVGKRRHIIAVRKIQEEHYRNGGDEPTSPNGWDRLLEMPFANRSLIFETIWSNHATTAETIARHLAIEQRTHCAIAIKVFRMRTGRFPTNLDELAETNSRLDSSQMNWRDTLTYEIAPSKNSAKLVQFFDHIRPGLDGEDQEWRSVIIK